MLWLNVSLGFEKSIFIDILWILWYKSVKREQFLSFLNWFQHSVLILLCLIIISLYKCYSMCNCSHLVTVIILETFNNLQSSLSLRTCLAQSLSPHYVLNLWCSYEPLWSWDPLLWVKDYGISLQATYSFSSVTLIRVCWNFLACYRDHQIKKGELHCNSVLKHPVQSLVFFL